MTFQEEVIDRLARIEQAMADHPGEHKDIHRRLGALEAENTHRSRLTVIISAITAAIMTAAGHFISGNH